MAVCPFRNGLAGTIDIGFGPDGFAARGAKTCRKRLPVVSQRALEAEVSLRCALVRLGDVLAPPLGVLLATVLPGCSILKAVAGKDREA